MTVQHGPGTTAEDLRRAAALIAHDAPAWSRRMRQEADRMDASPATALYAWQTDRPPLSPGCPATGWVHEGQEPWRVIVSEDRAKMDTLGKTFTVAEYTGDEETVWYDDWMIGAR